jgi:transcriptional regulator with XRE-family HTH domain
MPARSALAERRKALGLTQESLAEMLRVERSTVARWEQGSATPRPWYRRRLADALQVEPDELGKLLSLRSSHADLSTPAINGLDIDHDRQPEEHAATIRADARRLVELDTRYGSDDLVQLATRAVRLADQHLARGLVVSRSRRDFHAAVGELAQVAAWIAYDAERQPLARQLTTEALMHSRLAGDRHRAVRTIPTGDAEHPSRSGGRGDDHRERRHRGPQPFAKGGSRVPHPPRTHGRSWGTGQER